MHVPVETATAATDAARSAGADSCVVVGGGSSIGLGKAIALEHHLPIIAIPTTYAGSEMTPIWGLTRDGRKQTGRDTAVLPTSVIYDPRVTTTLPADISAASGLNAMAHAVEALYAPDTSPIISLMAEEGVRAFMSSLPAIVADGEDLARPRRRRSTGRGCAARAWARRRCRCITNCATSWAAPWTCRTHKHTPSCCRMRWPTTNPMRPQPAAALQRALDTDGRAVDRVWEMAQQLPDPALADRSRRQPIPVVSGDRAGTVESLRQPGPGDRRRAAPPSRTSPARRYTHSLTTLTQRLETRP